MYYQLWNVKKRNSWIVNSGATCHKIIWINKQSFLEFHSSEKPQHVTLGDGHSLSANETGNVAIELLLRNGNIRQCHLSDASSMCQNYHTIY